MTSKAPLTFQALILTLEKFWAEHGCLIWQPHHTEVGAGTMNPGTVLRVLGPEPWNVGYVEPSIRPDDGRYGENPNRFQQHYQYQVILKPDPGNPQELYLQSLEALGINLREHDVRFVEDNWESPALGAWGLGWEVWLDGQEITQFTYFQQSGGVPLDPVAVELTYGLERILIGLNNARGIWDEAWAKGVTYGDVLKRPEFEHSKYYFEVADVERLRQLYALYTAEAEACLAAGLVMPAHDYVLKMSHTFNVLDARGAIGVTERQAAFGRMRGLARKVSEAYLEQRKQMEYPLLKETMVDGRRSTEAAAVSVQRPPSSVVTRPSSLLLEIGAEELPFGDVASAIAQLQELTPKLLAEARLTHGAIDVFGTPRRLAVLVKELAPSQPDREVVVKGPPASRALDSFGEPTPAAQGFAKKNNVPVAALEKRSLDGGEYLVAVVKETGQPAPEVLRDLLPKLIAALKFEKTMRWRAGDPTAFSRPLRWIVALLGEQVIPFAYAGLWSGGLSRGLRPLGSPDLAIPHADAYLETLRAAHLEADPAKRRAAILEQARALAASVGGVLADEGVLDEVTFLVERPTALLGSFAQESLALPREVLIAVMKKHQRYFPVQEVSDAQASGARSDVPVTLDTPLLPYFIAVRNGDAEHLDIVRDGNEHVIRARFADAEFFVREDRKLKLEDFRARLSTLTFQQKLGSMLDKTERIEKLTAALAKRLSLSAAETQFALRAAHLCKADLATQMVVEMTSLQGVMGYEYALASGEPREAALAIREHYGLPETRPGLAVGLADRLDSLAGLFAVGLAPTGSADPFGLRRAALSTNQILIERRINLDLRAALGDALDLLPPALITDRTKLITDLLAFLAGRLRGQLLELGYRYDVVDAVLAEQAHTPFNALEAVKQLSAWVARADWAQILPAYARCVRITRDQPEQFSVNREQLKEPAEQELDRVSRSVESVQSVDQLLNAVLPMMPAINQFFDDVLVMADDPAVRANRLGLLQRIANLARGLADLSRLEGF
jgi:glycyl-tRNA synthetase